jgi:hypothetical protein
LELHREKFYNAAAGLMAVEGCGDSNPLKSLPASGSAKK